MDINTMLLEGRGMFTIDFSVSHKEGKFVLHQPNRSDVVLDNTNHLFAAVTTLLAPYLRADNLRNNLDMSYRECGLDFSLNVFRKVT